MNGNSFHWTSRDYGTASHDGSVRRQLLLKLYDRMLRLTHEQRDKALIQLREWTGTDSCHGGPGSALSTDEVVQLASNELIEIGAHSVTHPFLDRLPPAAQRLEIHQSKEVLEKLLGQSLAGFSYPNGAASQDTRAIVEDVGFAFACASTSDVTSHGSDRFYLPRFWIPNWDGETFARWLLRWLS
jgi:peptidoglycan/xylan/chitin deacetylase (PgdA/CDA1 family)